MKAFDPFNVRTAHIAVFVIGSIIFLGLLFFQVSEQIEAWLELITLREVIWFRLVVSLTLALWAIFAILGPQIGFEVVGVASMALLPLSISVWRERGRRRK